MDKTEKIDVELRLRQDLADHLPKGKNDRNNFISRAVEHELDPPRIMNGDVATREKCSPSTARQWASTNDVLFIGEGTSGYYLWSEGDIARFRKRDKPGRKYASSEYDFTADDE